MRCVSLLHTKGGVGKSTTCKNVAAYMAHLGKRVLMLDMDRQMTLTNQMRLSAADILPLVFSNQAPPWVEPVKTYIPNLDLIPCHQLLHQFVERNGKEECGRRLRAYIDRIAPNYDFMFVDGPPSWGAMNDILLFVTDEVIIPCQPTQANIEAVQPTLSDIDSWLAQHPAYSIPVRRVLWTMVKPGNKGDEYILAVGRYNNFPMFETLVRHSYHVRNSEVQYETIFEHSPRCTASKDYQSLVKELLHEKE